MFLQQHTHRVRHIMLLNAIPHFMSDDALPINANAMQILLPGTVLSAIYQPFLSLNLFIVSSILPCSGMYILQIWSRYVYVNVSPEGSKQRFLIGFTLCYICVIPKLLHQMNFRLVSENKLSEESKYDIIIRF